MASDIKNVSDGTGGTSRIGKTVVNTGGRRLNSYQVLDPVQPRVFDTDIADVHNKFDNRFDDPNYYG